MQSAGWPPWRRQTGCMCWTPAPLTGPRSACVPWGRWLWKRGWSLGGLTRPATALWSWYRRTRTSVCVPIWMRCFTRAGGRRWRRPGRTGPPRRSTAIPGTSTPTAPRAPCSGLRRSTPAGDTAGPTRFTRCWSGRRAGHRGGSARRRGCSWTTTPTPPNPGDSTCPCWSCRWRRPRRTTATPITWAGSTCSTAGGTTVSARWSATCPCPPPSGRMSGAPPCGFSPGRGGRRAGRSRPGGGCGGPSGRPLTCGSPTWSWRAYSMRRRSGTGWCTCAVRPWQLPTALRPISARRRRGGACPGICSLWGCTTPGGGARPWRPPGRPWLSPEDGRIRDNVAFLAG